MCKRQIYQTAESNRSETFFCPNWNALVGSRRRIGPGTPRRRVVRVSAWWQQLGETAAAAAAGWRVGDAGRRGALMRGAGRELLHPADIGCNTSPSKPSPPPPPSPAAAATVRPPSTHLTLSLSVSPSVCLGAFIGENTHTHTHTTV